MVLGGVVANAVTQTTTKTIDSKIYINTIGIDLPTDTELSAMFSIFDVNASGFIDRTEFANYMMNNFENYGVPMTQTDVNRLFAKLDGGNPNQNYLGKNDGKLSYAEFCVLILSRVAM